MFWSMPRPRQRAKQLSAVSSKKVEKLPKSLPSMESYEQEESTLKIIDYKLTPITVPMEAPLRWSLGVETGTTRTIVELMTDEGIVGLGETYGGEATVRALQFAKPLI